MGAFVDEDFRRQNEKNPLLRADQVDVGMRVGAQVSFCWPFQVFTLFSET